LRGSRFSNELADEFLTTEDTEVHRGSQRFTEVHRGSQRFTEVHRGSQRFTEVHRGKEE
jgi:hypothetical protein